MRTISYVLAAQVLDGVECGGDTSKALNLSDKRVNELVHLMEKDVEKKIAAEEGSTYTFDAMAALLDHIDNGDFDASDILFLVYAGYSSLDRAHRLQNDARFEGFDTGFMAASMGLDENEAKVAYAVASARTREGPGGSKYVDLNEMPKEIKDLVLKSRMASKEEEDE